MDYFTTNLIGTTTTTCLYILAFSVCNAVTMELDWIAVLALMHIPSLVIYTNCSPEALATILVLSGGIPKPEGYCVPGTQSTCIAEVTQVACILTNSLNT